MKRLPRFVPTTRLAGLLIALSPLWLLSFTWVGMLIAAVFFLALIIAAVLDALLLPGPRSVRVFRHFPGSVGVSDDSPGEYEIHSEWPRPLRAGVFDRLPLAVTRTDSARDVEVPPYGSAQLPVSVQGVTRGRWELGRVVLRVRGPLGLVERTLRYEPRDSITVTPSIRALRTLRLLTLQRRLRDAGIRQVRRRGTGTTFGGLREYVVGDDPRHLDWKATARRGRLITREYTVEQGQTVMIAVDAGRMMTQLFEERPRFEYALSSALVLADVAVSSGDRVGLIIFDDQVRAFLPPQRGRSALERIRELLIPAQAALVEPDYAAAFRTIAERHRKRSLIVIFTDVIDPRSSAALVAHTVRSTVRHLPLVVALRNEALLAAAAPAGRDDTGSLYNSAAAEELVTAREGALAQMRQAGVAVLDVAPHVMSAAVVNRYLDIKGRAGL